MVLVTKERGHRVGVENSKKSQPWQSFCRWSAEPLKATCVAVRFANGNKDQALGVDSVRSLTCMTSFNHQTQSLRSDFLQIFQMKEPKRTALKSCVQSHMAEPALELRMTGLRMLLSHRSHHCRISRELSGGGSMHPRERSWVCLLWQEI